MDYLSTLATGIWQYGIMFLLVLTLVVFIHELGHFLVARWCGVAYRSVNPSAATAAAICRLISVSVAPSSMPAK